MVKSLQEDRTVKPAPLKLRIAVIVQAAILMFVVLVALNIGS